MNRQPAGDTQALESAFVVFNEMSLQLEAAYRELEARVATLTEQLAAAHSQRLHELAEKERLAERLAQLVDALPGGVIVVDGDGRITDCNAAAVELLGEPLLGERWHDVLTRLTGASADAGGEIICRDGRRINISQRTLAAGGGRIVLLNDVTETRRLQQTADRQQRLSAMGEMVARLAHQIRTPLSAALLYAAPLARPSLSDAERERFSGRLLSRLRHLERLIGDMLLFARGGAGDDDRFMIDDLVRELEETVLPVLRQAGIGWRVANRASGAWLAGNREMLLGALGNLVDNSAQAVGRGGHIAMAIGVNAAGRLQICIEDDGPGIDPQVMERIFEPFFTTRSSGTGLGLAVVRASMAVHGGEVRAENRPEGGARFCLSLPVAPADAAVTETEHKRRSA